ncbi:MAG: hypothetical protein ACH36H_04485 [Candidatus Nanopelagicales bacterium]
MRLLVYLAVLVVVVAGLVWAVERVRDRRRLPTHRRPDELPSGSLAAAAEAMADAPPAYLVEERATLAYGLDRGPGLLRLTPSQLIFLADSGRVVLLDRLDVLGVGSTRDLPDRTLTREVLVVTTEAQVAYFAVAEPEEWVQRLG